MDLFCQQQGHRCGGAKYGGFQIHHHFTVHVGVGGSQWNGHGAESLAAGLKTHPCSPQTVSDGNLDTVFAGQAGKFVATGKKIAPVVEILLGITKHFALAGGSRGGVDAAYIFKISAAQWKRIPFLQILLVGKRQALQILQRTNVFGFHAGGVELFAVERCVAIGVVDGPLKTGQLYAAQLLLAQVAGNKRHRSVPPCWLALISGLKGLQ